MIGVIPKANQLAAVEEFFQLFKTPWEPFREGRHYDVVIVTADTFPDVNARLVIVYGAEVLESDARWRISPRGKVQHLVLNFGGQCVPIYGDALTFRALDGAVACVEAETGIAGVEIDSNETRLLRIGYDVFNEAELVLSNGQPAACASIATLELHIRMLREWILAAGIPVLEIPPVPAGYKFAVCLTHDIDFVGIRRHKFDHTFWGFLWRSTVGALVEFARRRISLGRLLRMWRAAASLPLVMLGWMKDFWEPFEWYFEVERGLPATYFLIPFKEMPGERLTMKHAARRASKYDITDIPDAVKSLVAAGCEAGVHGIDAWHSIERGRVELERVRRATGRAELGIRMHWLQQDATTAAVLDKAGYAYDSTACYNETVGYRCGTGQVFRPPGATHLLELPAHIQDGALFFPERMNLTETEAWERCMALIENADEFGGVLTVLWHDRSHGPERFWGDFYVRLINELKSREVWFGSAGEVVNWFRKRRHVSFERAEIEDGAVPVTVRYDGDPIKPPLALRIHRPATPQGDGADISVIEYATLSSPNETCIDLTHHFRRTERAQCAGDRAG